ncbi:hypothetical protein HPB47_026958 [Ixodes persulcatus]|uniref:Uncharacterized protein n=1 Tax=Ixodes persulcatus TaxID=34615 RepID=A0AC60PYV8_IXOPE|nr:hypothetical protein HPB47_026958 [Ixodes persulcatus]
MAADTSFTEFADFVLKTDELLYHVEEESRPVSRRCLRNRLSAMEVFNDRELFALYRFTKATVASLLRSLTLEECQSSRRLPPMFQLLIAPQFYGAGTFRCTITGDLPTLFPSTVCRVIGRLSRLIDSTLCHRLCQVPGDRSGLGPRDNEIAEVNEIAEDRRGREPWLVVAHSWNL